MSSFLTGYLKDDQVFECTKKWHLDELETAGVKDISRLKIVPLPIYVKLQSHPTLGYSFSWASESKDYSVYGYKKGDYTKFVPFETFYNECKVQCNVKDDNNFTAEDALRELYIMKQENGDINEMFDYLVHTDSDLGKLADYLYEHREERLSEQERDM